MVCFSNIASLFNSEKGSFPIWALRSVAPGAAYHLRKAEEAMEKRPSKNDLGLLHAEAGGLDRVSLDAQEMALLQRDPVEFLVKCTEKALSFDDKDVWSSSSRGPESISFRYRHKGDSDTQEILTIVGTNKIQTASKLIKVIDPTALDVVAKMSKEATAILAS